MSEKLDAGTKWSYCVGATGRDAAYALVSMYLILYVQYTMNLTSAQFAVISGAMILCMVWDAVNDLLMGIRRVLQPFLPFMGNDLHNERHCLLGSSPLAELRSGNQRQPCNNYEHFHLYRTVFCGGCRASGNRGKCRKGIQDGGTCCGAGARGIPAFDSVWYQGEGQKGTDGKIIPKGHVSHLCQKRSAGCGGSCLRIF